jgi:hypothetical protein
MHFIIVVDLHSNVKMYENFMSSIFTCGPFLHLFTHLGSHLGYRKRILLSVTAISANDVAAFTFDSLFHHFGQEE